MNRNPGDAYGLDDEFVAGEFISALSNNTKSETMQIFAGSVFGLENFFSKHGNIVLDSIVTMEMGLVGYIEYTTLRTLFHIDKRFGRVMRRNFFKSLLDSVKPYLPMLW
jgi:hypothetical protein